MHQCKCGIGAIMSYRQRLSEPLLDRIDMTLEVGRLSVVNSSTTMKSLVNRVERADDSIRKVARTIADLDGSDEIQVPHLAEAIQYRSGEERLRG